MTIEKKHPDYQIRGLTYRKEAGSIRFRWRYKEAADFLIFLYDGRQTFDLAAACEEITALGLSDSDLLDQARKLLPAGKDAFWKLAHIKKAEFVRDGKCFILPAQELKKDVPYGICVFACTFDTETKQLSVYQSDTQENTCYLPIKIKAEIRYKTRLFSKEKYCMLRLPQMEDYKDGALLYHDGHSVFYCPGRGTGGAGSRQEDGSREECGYGGCGGQQRPAGESLYGAGTAAACI